MKPHASKRCVLVGFLCVLAACIVLLLLETPSATVRAVHSRDQNDAVHGNATAAYLSQHKSISIRGQYQKNQVERYCSQHGWAHLRNTLPKEGAQRTELNRHLLYNDTVRVIFCFLEKVGCTNLKRMMFVAFGLLDERTTTHEWVDYHPYLDGALMKSSFGQKALTEADRIHKMRAYFKFMFVRHPFERLLSAYRNKIEPPLTDMGMGFPKNLKHAILERYRPAEYQSWRDGGCRYNITVSFPDFVQHVIDTDNSALNPHFKPAIDTCHPCRIRYDFYGNFKLYKQDALMISHFLGFKPEYFPDFDLHIDGFHTSDLLGSYYSKLSAQQKSSLLGDFKDELEFYCSLYPTEDCSKL